MKNLAYILIKMFIVLILVSFTSGCVSGYAINNGYNRACEKSILASGDDDAIKSMKMGGDPKKIIRGIVLNDGRGGAPGIAVDISPGIMQGVKEAGWWLVPSAVADLAIGYGVKYAYDNMSDDNNSESENQRHDIESGRDTVIINGDGNDVDVNTTFSGGE